MGKLEGLNALITGGSRGIGYAVAQRLGREGARVFLTARSEQMLKEAADRLRAEGIRAEMYVADVVDQASVRGMVDRAVATLGRIDILVNNAGTYKAARFVDYSLADFDRVMKVNVYGTFNVTQAVLPLMLAQGKGKVINVASTAGKWGSRNQSAYNASKHAVVGLTRCIALEVAASNVTVNAVCPTLVLTDLAETYWTEQSAVANCSPEEIRETLLATIPNHRFVEPEEVAGLVLYLASADADGVNGQSISLCGGTVLV